MDLGVSGLASGFDWRSFVEQIVDVERAPQQTLRLEQNTIQQKKLAYSSIRTQLAVLQSRLDTLKDPALFSSRTVHTSDDELATATANHNAAPGKYDFNIIQLATAARLNGSSNIAAGLASTGDASSIALSNPAFSKPITGGTFTVNGAQITLDPAGTLQDVFNSIESATGGSVTGAYDPATDTITLSAASGELVLGSATDTSNFLSVARLHNNGTGSITSTGALGNLDRSAALSTANFATAVDDGGAGAGLFKVNGVDISYNATTDSLDDVISRINSSGAGVLASYDAVNDRLVLSNQATGDMGISVQDVTGNFAAAAGLATGTLERGKNLLYTVNDGGTLVSASNSITEETSGVAGLTLTATGEGDLSVTVGSDTAKVKSAIQDFITEYNKVQSIIDTNTASSTSAEGKVTAGTLADEADAASLGRKLRSSAFAAISGFDVAMNELADLGISTSGTDNSLTLQDEAALDAALADNLSGVAKLFSDPTDGLAVKLNNYLDNLMDDDTGSLTAKDSNLAKNIAAIDTQIADMERLVQSNRQRLMDSFVQMETAQAQISQQLQFLMQRFGGGSGAA